jgi:uncharacterized membrane protein
MKRAAQESRDIRCQEAGATLFLETSRTEPTREKKESIRFCFPSLFLYLSLAKHILYIRTLSYVLRLCFSLFHNSLITFPFFLAYFIFLFVSVLSSKRTVPKFYLMSLSSVYKTNIHNSLVTFPFSYVLESDSISF